MQYIRRLFTRHYQIEDSSSSLAYAEALVLKEFAGSNLEYRDKIASVVDDIHEKHLVKFPKVSGQDYDRLLFIFRLLLENTSYPEQEKVERNMAVLRNLKHLLLFKNKEI
ncbi:hypothetical protein DD238_004188 [Peronospora effusa]|uniref:Uncharacterized protein n=1 Tax=Peronospora effusa TaxID=542832 RepID=A0A3M6VBX5_9STRA|nr:hypothetical protein DD238_004188 [Peronospora effusa]